MDVILAIRCNGDDGDEWGRLILFSAVTEEGITETDLGQTLLNGNNIAMVSSKH